MKKNISPAKSGILLGVMFGVLMVLEFVIMYVIGMKSLANSECGNHCKHCKLPYIPYHFYIYRL